MPDDGNAPTASNQDATAALTPSLKRHALAARGRHNQQMGAQTASVQHTAARPAESAHVAVVPGTAQAEDPTFRLVHGMAGLDLERTPLANLSPAGRAMKNMPQALDQGLTSAQQQRLQPPDVTDELAVLGGGGSIAAQYQQRRAAAPPTARTASDDVVVVGSGCAIMTFFISKHAVAQVYSHACGCGGE